MASHPYIVEIITRVRPQGYPDRDSVPNRCLVKEVTPEDPRTEVEVGSSEVVVETHRQRWKWRAGSQAPGRNVPLRRRRRRSEHFIILYYIFVLDVYCRPDVSI